jgi:hypothetical protein
MYCPAKIRVGRKSYQSTGIRNNLCSTGSENFFFRQIQDGVPLKLKNNVHHCLTHPSFRRTIPIRASFQGQRYWEGEHEGCHHLLEAVFLAHVGLDGCQCAASPEIYTLYS